MLSVELRIDTSFPPHSFLVVVGPDGVERGYGFAPNPSGLVAPGQVRDDTRHPADVFSGKAEITQAQYDSLMNYISTTTANPPAYAAFYGSQCSTWAVNALAQMGMIPPLGVPNMQPSNILVDFVESVIFQPWMQSLGIGIQNLFTAAQTYVRPPPPPTRRDPLVLDLNGNGIETVGINTAAPILFDGNGDGVKTATGWVNTNDGLLVWDRNGNGVIDSGRELFGDATVKSDGTLASDGFNALADLDLNHDGIVNTLDADFSNLRVWRDLNQNGVSDAGEVSTLDTYQIAGINVANTAANTALGNGNTLNLTGSYVRSDGTTGLAGNINLASNVFFSRFTDALPPTAEIQALPDMQGAGMVRGLRDAAGRSPQLATILGQYAAATSDVQKAMLDNVLGQWSATSTFLTTADRAATLVSGVSTTSITLEGIAAGTPAYAAFMDKLSVVERFNAGNFQALPSDPNTTLSYTILREQQAFIDQSYQALKGSVYDSLLVQTRLKPYLDAITLGIGAGGITMDTGGINAALDALNLTDPKGALLDLIELNRVEGKNLYLHEVANDGKWRIAA